MPHYRVGAVTDEFGRKVSVTYGRPHPCDNGDPYPNGGWDSNQYNCFPQQWTPENAAQPQFGIFHKRLITRVTAADTTGRSPTLIYQHSYGIAGDEFPAWHHDADEFIKLVDQQRLADDPEPAVRACVAEHADTPRRSGPGWPLTPTPRSAR